MNKKPTSQMSNPVPQTSFQRFITSIQAEKMVLHLKFQSKKKALSNTGAEINVINSVELKKLDLLTNSMTATRVRNASGKSMDTKGKVTLKFKINGKAHIHTYSLLKPKETNNIGM